jgi:hypothetical protein
MKVKGMNREATMVKTFIILTGEPPCCRGSLNSIEMFLKNGNNPRDRGRGDYRKDPPKPDESSSTYSASQFPVFTRRPVGEPDKWSYVDCESTLCGAILFVQPGIERGIDFGPRVSFLSVFRPLTRVVDRSAEKEQRRASPSPCYRLLLATPSFSRMFSMRHHLVKADWRRLRSTTAVIKCQ